MSVERVTTDDGVDLHVVVDGRASAPPLLLVNGAFCALPVWDNLIGDLTSHYRVIRHDVRGTGRSQAGPADGYRFERYAADLINISDHLAVDRAHLWGMAWGARVALVAAALDSDRYQRLVLSDLSIDPADPDAQRAGAKMAAAARAEAGIPEAPKPAGWNAHDDDEAAAKAMAATRLHPDLFNFATRVANPTLIVTGDNDPNLASSRRALAGLADARLEVVAMCGHGLVRQRPDVATATVLPFLGAG